MGLKERCQSSVFPRFWNDVRNEPIRLYCGDSIMLPRFEIEEVLETIKREQPTTFPGVPTCVALMNHPKAEDYEWDQSGL
jgi:acyl-CoA synthetase (AMP-forming)/AMP-acid ligase II